MNDIELEFKILKLFSKSPNFSQRKLALKLGISLGKANYVIKALTKLGILKLENFKRSDNKLGYLYIITPKGMARKTEVAKIFFRQKTEEYFIVRKELKILKKELNERN